MSNYNLSSTQAGAGQNIDQGLRSYMLGVYNYMALGVALTGVVAYLLSSNMQLMAAIWGTPLKWVAIFAPLAFSLLFGFGVNSMKSGTAKIVFFAYAAAMGVSLSMLLMVYTGESVARTFFVSSAAFGALSLYGYTTKKDLSGLGTFLMMGMFGLLIAGLVNIFLQSSMMQFVISAVGVLIFAGLTAYDTQNIKEMYYENDNGEVASKKSILGAFKLYTDFIAIFIHLLQFMGDRR